MKIEVEDISPVMKRLTIEVPEEEVKALVDDYYRELKKEVAIEGFRKGKVPENVLRQRFGKRVMSDVAKNLMEKTYPQAIKEKGYKPISSPDIDIKQCEEGSPFVYTALVQIKPVIDVKGYRGMECKEVTVEVADEDVEKSLEQLRQSYGEFHEVDREARKGDMVVVDVELSCGGEKLEGGAKGYRFVLGESARFPEFDTATEGLKSGDTTSFTKSFPEGYHDKLVAGKEVEFHITVKSVKEKVLPALDDEFAKTVGFNSLEELKNRVKEEILRAKEKVEKDRVKSEIMDKLIEENSFELPPSLVDNYFRQIVSNIMEGIRKGVVDPAQQPLTPEEFKARYMGVAEKQARGDIILDAIAEKENIEVTDEEVEALIKDMAERRGESPEELRENILKAGIMDAIIDGMRREKVFDFLLKGGNQ